MKTNNTPTQDVLTGLRAMKKIKILITDEVGTLLDRTEIEVASDCTQIAIRPIEGTLAERPEETTLVIGS